MPAVLESHYISVLQTSSNLADVECSIIHHDFKLETSEIDLMIKLRICKISSYSVLSIGVP